MEIKKRIGIWGKEGKGAVWGKRKKKKIKKKGKSKNK
jgi:hypothetical protein